MAGSAGHGTGGPWRLEISSDLAIEVLGWLRSPDGLLKPLPGAAAVRLRKAVR